jgi:hypothetical protein
VQFRYVEKINCQHPIQIEHESLGQKYGICFSCGVYTIMQYERLDHRIMNFSSRLAVLGTAATGVSGVVLSLLAIFGLRL